MKPEYGRSFLYSMLSVQSDWMVRALSGVESKLFQLHAHIRLETWLYVLKEQGVLISKMR